MLTGSPYQGYTYAYPHKTAYRWLEPPVPLSRAWSGEPKGSLFLYMHVPYCEMRCGFCNLFTMVARPASDYLAVLRRQAETVRAEVRPEGFARVAIGGGTPTVLEPAELDSLLSLVSEFADLREVPCSVETSPATATPARLACLRQAGVQRVSLGVQSFLPAERKAMGRPGPEPPPIRGFPRLNLDLIYGIPGQTRASLVESLERAMAWEPTEVFLYPLYIRPLTGLDGLSPQDWDRQRLDLYRQGRDYLRSRGFRQLSMRSFSRVEQGGPDYCCQDDGLLGLGPGARSYTRALHYSSDYAVARAQVRAVVDDFLATADFSQARYGVRLEPAEQRLRWLLKSLLRAEGLDLEAFPWPDEVPEAAPLLELGWARREGRWLRLTEAGLERSDAIGPWLYSPAVRDRMEAFCWR